MQLPPPPSPSSSPQIFDRISRLGARLVRNQPAAQVATSPGPQSTGPMSRGDGHGLKEEEEWTQGKFCKAHCNQSHVCLLCWVMDASHEVGGVRNGSGSTGTSSWEHMQEKRVRDLKAAAAETKQRMEESITADIASDKIKPKVKRNRQPKSAKQIDEEDYNEEDSL
ncbi:hypothetical protein B0H14DRAFT_2627858 [Mycena olivaceomarginata]|nr:hypothetical protein B0H14DRAFT_2627858 [Mycena olivaceomarginata]